MTATLFDLPTPVKHPARYTDALLPTFVDMLRGADRILDPFGGTGKVFLLERWMPWAEIQAVEIEPEWAALNPRTTLGNALDLPWSDGYFDAVCTSPCLTRDQRILTASLEWVQAGDIQVGEKLLAFDEFNPLRTNGRRGRRTYRIAEVIESHPARKHCVRVTMENGESVTCTLDHPWLATRYEDNSRGPEWVQAKDLLSLHDPHVLRQFDTWTPNESYMAGWVAGMFDGEGSLSYGVHGSPKLMICQTNGEILDLAEERLGKLGYQTSIIQRKNGRGKPMSNLYVSGGFPGILRALGELRPTRLLQKVYTLDAESRCIQPQKVRVVSVEDIGEQEIQGITTSTGTYIGEGYLMHNTYGNRMADTLLDGYERITYTAKLGRKLHADNAGAMQWGDEYRQFHVTAWTEANRVLSSGGRFVLNIKDHIRASKRQHVTEWHIEALQGLGLQLVEHRQIDCPGNRYGQNAELRVEYESVVLFRKP